MQKGFRGPGGERTRKRAASPTPLCRKSQARVNQGHDPRTGRWKHGPPLSGVEVLHSIHSSCQGQPRPAAKHSSSPMRTCNHAHFLQEAAVKLRNILACSKSHSSRDPAEEGSGLRLPCASCFQDQRSEVAAAVATEPASLRLSDRRGAVTARSRAVGKPAKAGRKMSAGRLAATVSSGRWGKRSPGFSFSGFSPARSAHI